MKNPKPNRKRNKRLQFWVSDDEITAIRERAQSIGIVNLGAYLRKMSIDGMIVQLDLSDVREMVSLLRRCSNNLNQIAKRANETHSVYETDIQDLRRQYDTLWDTANKILQVLAKIPT